ncbi:hypothetical protein L915_19879 [Phytophthora nicotianae]|uniref:Uncharacterized protein n=1 Tax=Phytophthora nicotianae TaxID=4792 RepID=W2M9N3_PHYNI|nr:hypothetical protein L915_19879 [Phytophthora nicotianae]ETM33066.1 hypothetical protein L914_19659 [Phytophthora nicotianae]
MQDVMTLWVTCWLYVQWLFETHGWKLLGAALLTVWGRQRYREYAARRHQEKTLAAANGTSPLTYGFKANSDQHEHDSSSGYPARVAVLQRETARVRTKQQDQHIKSSKVKVEKAA